MNLVEQYRNLHFQIKECAIKMKEGGERHADLYRYRFQIDGYEELAIDFPTSEPLQLDMAQDLIATYIRLQVHGDNLEGILPIE